jgi:hypothetical protein
MYVILFPVVFIGLLTIYLDHTAHVCVCVCVHAHAHYTLMTVHFVHCICCSLTDLDTNEMQCV